MIWKVIKCGVILSRTIEPVVMDVRFLETFIIAVDHGSFAEAARQQGLTPAGVAQRVRALETLLEVQLLQRSGREVRPTEAGRAILDHGRRIIAESRELRNLTSVDASVGELHIGAISTALTGLLPDALSRLNSIAPRLDVFLTPGTSKDLYQNLIDGHIDVAVVIAPPFPFSKALEWQPLRSEGLLLLVGAEEMETDVRVLLNSRPYIRYDRTNWGGRLADSYLQDLKVGVTPRFELDSLEAIMVMVSRGLGISLIPDWAKPWPADVAVAAIPVQGDQYNRRIGLLYPRSSPRLRRIQLFRSAF